MQNIKDDMLPGIDREEQGRIMRQWFDELWDDALEQGLEPELIARVVIQKTLQELVHKNGPEEAERVRDEITQLDEHGAFLSEITLQ